MPVRRDHARQRVRARRVLDRDDLIYTKDMLLAEPIKTGAGRGRRPLRHADPLLQDVLVIARNVVVWAVWIVAAFSLPRLGHRGRHVHQPFYSALALIGNLASLAVLYLLLSAEFVAARAGARLRRRGDGDVPVRDRLPRGRADAPWAGGPSWQQFGAVLAAGAILVEVIVVIGLKAGGRLSPRGQNRRQLRLAAPDRARVPDRPPARVRDHLDRAARRAAVGVGHPRQRIRAARRRPAS